MKNIFRNYEQYFSIKADHETELSHALLRALTFAAIFFILPPEVFYKEFYALNSIAKCTNYFTYSYGVNLNLGTIEVLYSLLRASLILSALGLAFTFSSLVSFIAFSLLTIHSLSGCYSNHFFYPIGVVLLLWFLNGNSSKYSLDIFLFKKKHAENKSYIFKFLKIHFALIFFFAGLSKLRNSGFDWVFSENLKNVLILQNYFHQGQAGSPIFEKINEFIIASLFLPQLLGAATIFIELSAALLLFANRWRWWIVILIAFLQLGFSVGLYINFYPWVVLYLVWIVSFINDYMEKRDFLSRLLKCKGEE